MERRADGKGPLAASRMNIHDDAAQRENSGLHEVRDSIRDRSASVPRKRPVHIDAIQGRDPRIRGAGAFAQLRHQDYAPSNLLRFQIHGQALYGNLALVLVPVCPAKTDHGVGVSAAASVNDRQRDERVSPGAVQVKGDLVVLLTRTVEVYEFRAVDDGSHRFVVARKESAYQPQATGQAE